MISCFDISSKTANDLDCFFDEESLYEKMQTIQKAEGFEGQKIIVFPDVFLEDIAHHPLIRPLYITDIGSFPQAHYHYRERQDGCNAFVFIYCIEGEGWAMLEKSNKIPVYKNTMLVIPANTSHSYGADTENPWSIYWFHLKGEAVEQFVREFDLCNFTVSIPTTQTIRIIDLLDQCYETLLYKGYSFKHYLYVSQMMKYVLGILTLQSEPHENKKKNEYVERSIRYMIEHVQSSLTLDELANHVGLSKPHFVHLFKQVTQHSPIDYYLRLKIQRSCHYLDLTDYNVKTISQNVGFQDSYYFSRMFHKIMGQSPSSYRKTK